MQPFPPSPKVQHSTACAIPPSSSPKAQSSLPVQINTCTDDQHVGTAQVIVAQGDALCHHLCPPLRLKSLRHQQQEKQSLSFNAGFQVRSQESRTEGDNHLPWLDGHSSVDAAQNAFGLLDFQPVDSYPIPYPLNSPPLKSISPQFRDQGIVWNCVKGLPEVQIDGINRFSLVNWCRSLHIRWLISHQIYEI